ncbi:HAD-IA family hydrolase [Brevundimonas sp.]|uniref:HAD-IA family hydrolase n=1 Tax=Brevundimonas sp. TaxID=1871086 RepID=UPI002BCBC2A5|nr:HAD-IA family hydrolase [Brevundimonas sp.]HWQ87912.1 HAD-IA family hydrolase [Brevundimonas sp.]
MTERDLHGWTIAFDLDGTLVETAPDLVGTLNRLLAQRNLPPVPLESARHLIGHGAIALLKRGFEAAGARWDEDAAPALLSAFLADYLDHIADHSTVYPGSIRALDQLAARGAILCVATNKPTDLAVALFEVTHPGDRFAAVCGPQSVSAKKPDAAHIREAVIQAGGDPGRAIMVGDSVIDLNAARAAGVPCILTTFGYTDIPAADLGADAVIAHYDDLPAAIGRLIA